MVPVEFRMTVNLFGETLSSGCSNLALKTTADDNIDALAMGTADILENEFYVDDGLTGSTPTIQEAVTLVKNSIDMCKKGGFRLHKHLPNKREVIESLSSIVRVR